MTTTAAPVPATQLQQTREGWLVAAAELLWPRIVAAGGTRPERCRVSCGWPSGGALLRASSNRRTLGEAWHGGSEDGAREVFISPALALPVEVLDVLGHELVHAACEPGTGHGPVFAAICKSIGWTNGKPTQARAGDKALEELAEMAKALGPYPHAKLDRMPTGKQKGRMVKGLCPDCGVILYGSRNAWDQGLPECGACGQVFTIDDADGSAAQKIGYTGPQTYGETLQRVSSTIEYGTPDKRFTVRVSRVGDRDTRVLVTDHEAVPSTRQVGDHELTEYAERWTIRHNREDALAFMAALRSGDVTWDAVEELEAELEADDDVDFDDEDVLGPVGDWGGDDDFLDDDEDETPDYEDGTLDADEEAAYEEATRRREASGEATSQRIAAGSEKALD